MIISSWSMTPQGLNTSATFFNVTKVTTSRSYANVAAGGAVRYRPSHGHLTTVPEGRNEVRVSVVVIVRRCRSQYFDPRDADQASVVL